MYGKCSGGVVQKGVWRGWAGYLPSSGREGEQAIPNPSCTADPDPGSRPLELGVQRGGQFWAGLHTAVATAAASHRPYMGRESGADHRSRPPLQPGPLSTDLPCPCTEPCSHPRLLVPGARHGSLSVPAPPGWCPTVASSCASPQLWH